MLFNIGKPIFQYNTNMKLRAEKLADENGTRYAHFRYSDAIFPECKNNENAEIVDKSIYLRASNRTELTFKYTSGSWHKGETEVELEDYGIEYDESATPAENEEIKVTLTDLVSVEVDENNEAAIPNLLLQFSGQFMVYGYIVGDDGALTLVQETFRIIARPIPPEYVYIESAEVITYPQLVKLVNDLNALKQTLSTWTATVDANVGTPSVDITMSASGTSLAFHNLKGNTGEQGETGNGIASITKTSTSGLQDTYTILYTNGTTTTFIVTNGRDGIDGEDGVGISSIAKTGTAGKVDTYTITYTNGSTSTFNVTNGNDGTDGVSVTNATIDSNGHLIITLSNGQTVDTGMAKGPQGNPGATGTTFTPAVSSEGVISWTNDGGKENPQSVNIKGPQGETGATGPSDVRFNNITQSIVNFDSNPQTQMNITNKKLKNVIELLKGSEYTIEQGTTPCYQQSVPTGSQPYASLGMLGGKSVVWNQLCSSIARAGTFNGITVTKNTDNSYTYDGTATRELRFYFTDLDHSIPLATIPIHGHKYYMSGCPSGGSLSTYFVAYVNGGGGLMDYSNSADTGNGIIGTVRSDSNGGVRTFGFIIKSGITISNLKVQLNFIDLTQLYGTGNEPTSLTDEKITFIKHYLADHPEYNAGAIVSGKVSELESVDSDNVVIATKSVPSAVQQLDGYGESAGSAVNETNYETKKFYKRAGKIDLSTVGFSASGSYWLSNSAIPNIKIPASNYTKISGISDKYTMQAVVGLALTNSDIAVSQSGQLYIYNPSITSASDISGNLYFALATPVETDISEYLTDDNFIETENGGTVAFKQQNDTKLPVPNKVEYMVKIEEAI